VHTRTIVEDVLERLVAENLVEAALEGIERTQIRQLEPKAILRDAHPAVVERPRLRDLPFFVADRKNGRARSVRQIREPAVPDARVEDTARSGTPVAGEKHAPPREQIETGHERQANGIPQRCARHVRIRPAWRHPWRAGHPSQPASNSAATCPVRARAVYASQYASGCGKSASVAVPAT
jgi:hypothetical protein